MPVHVLGTLIIDVTYEYIFVGWIRQNVNKQHHPLGHCAGGG
jgi:hypothetical protein